MNRATKRFMVLALLMLLAGMFFGIAGGLQYILPAFFKEWLPFTKTRPLHVSFVISWIFTAAAAGIYYYLPKVSGRPLFSMRMAQIHFYLLIATTASITICYLAGVFGGREYLEFPPLLAIPVIAYWILFMVNCFKTMKLKGKQPVYIWMWSTGLIFFLLTTCESYLWMIPFFRDTIVRDVTVQWKAMGAMVGSWNILVYGTAFYVMEKISGDSKTSRSPLTFFFYFLGLVNLMFNWGHHTYIVPASPWIRNISYLISMTELLILGSILLNWKKSLSAARKHFHRVPYRFLFAADVWIFLNLILAILMSIPAVNRYTHGTHITAAHAMGSTIGINTMILLASFFFIAEKEAHHVLVSYLKSIKAGYAITQVSLFLFWISLIGTGTVAALEKSQKTPFAIMMIKLSPWFHAFTAAGIVLFAGIIILSIPLFAFLKQGKHIEVAVNNNLHVEVPNVTKTILTHDVRHI